MHFGLTEEQELLQETVKGFVAGECPPTRLRELFDAKQGHEPALWRGLAEMGLSGLVVPEAYGGAELEILDLALVAEALGGGSLPGPFLCHSLACIAIAKGGDAAQRERWLPGLASGEAVGTVALAEGEDLWEPGEWSLVESGGQLRGTKQYVPFADVADIIVVGTAGGGLAVVARGAAGMTLEPLECIDHTRPVATLVFDGTPAEALADGSAAAPQVRDAGLVTTAADAFGAAWALTQMSTDYAKTREQFGMPIAHFQAVKHQLADMAVTIEPTRGLFWYAAYACDHIPDEAPRQAAIAKAHITDRAADVAREAVQVHGGIGFTWECDVQMWFKRVLFDRAFLGDPSYHRMRSAELGGW
jgi:alkylation response protein AidB-like acyl-CoA dehydrogenase